MRSTSNEWHLGRLVGLSGNRNNLEVLEFTTEPERLCAHNSGRCRSYTTSRRQQGFFWVRFTDEARNEEKRSETRLQDL
jgi:hypothetical protein